MANQHHRLDSKISTNVRFRCCRFLSIGGNARDVTKDVEPRFEDLQITPPQAGWYRLPSGIELYLRPVRSDDKQSIDRFFTTLSPRSRQQRFLRPKERLTPKELGWVTETQPHRHWAWVAEREQDSRSSVIGFAEAFRDTSGEEAEIAVAVLDEWQGEKLGTALLAAVGQSAAAAGVNWLYGFTYKNNQRILTYGDHRDAIITPQGDDTVRLEFATEKIRKDLPKSLDPGRAKVEIVRGLLTNIHLESPTQKEPQ